MQAFQSLTRADLENWIQERLASLGSERAYKKARYHASHIFKWFYRRQVRSFSEMSDLPKGLREDLEKTFSCFSLESSSEAFSEDGTRKFLWKLSDGKTIESVLIPAKETDRLTLCISSQVGCAMACQFCLTGVQGLDRNLEVEEIVTQVDQLANRYPVTNIVFMGMGEPLHNLENVIKACQILVDPLAMNFSSRKVTVSTSGLVPAIRRLGEEAHVMLAVSLNATTDVQRTEIMPVNKKWPISELLRACREYPHHSFKRLTFEYVLLKDFNDQIEDARRLADLVPPSLGKINLIPFNEHSGSKYRRPDDRTVIRFQKYLLDRGRTVTLRHSRGRDILAACGQLRSLFGTARGTDRHSDAPAAISSS